MRREEEEHKAAEEVARVEAEKKAAEEEQKRVAATKRVEEKQKAEEAMAGEEGSEAPKKKKLKKAQVDAVEPEASMWVQAIISCKRCMGQKLSCFRMGTWGCACEACTKAKHKCEEVVWEGQEALAGKPLGSGEDLVELMRELVGLVKGVKRELQEVVSGIWEEVLGIWDTMDPEWDWSPRRMRRTVRRTVMERLQGEQKGLGEKDEGLEGEGKAQGEE